MNRRNFFSALGRFSLVGLLKKVEPIEPIITKNIQSINLPKGTTHVTNMVLSCYTTNNHPYNIV